MSKSEEKKLGRKRVHSALSLTVHDITPTVYPPSDVDTSANEPLERLIARHLRGEISPRFVPQYLPEGTPPEQAISEMDVTQQPGFDLADASEAMRRAEEVRDEERRKSKKPVPQKEGDSLSSGPGITPAVVSPSPKATASGGPEKPAGASPAGTAPDAGAE